jgi:hypothetical protein
MPGNSINRKCLEIAIETVLHKYQNQLQNITADDQPRLLKDMVAEISERAAAFEQISESVLNRDMR